MGSSAVESVTTRPQEAQRYTAEGDVIFPRTAAFEHMHGSRRGAASGKAKLNEALQKLKDARDGKAKRLDQYEVGPFPHTPRR